MNHAPSHRNCCGHDMVKKSWLASMAHSIDPALRNGEVDGFGEVERDSAGIPEV